MRKLISVFVCLVMLFALAAALAEAAEEAAPQLEDFAGEYIGKFISFGDNIIPLDEGEYYTLKIEGDEAEISEGIVTGTNGPGTMTIKLVFEEGTLCWQPEGSDVKVCVLRLLEDGTLTITFEVNPNIPVFRFEKVEAEPETEAAE